MLRQVAITASEKIVRKDAAPLFDGQVVGLPRVLIVAPHPDGAAGASVQAGLIQSKLTDEGWPVAACYMHRKSAPGSPDSARKYSLTDSLDCIKEFIRGIPQANIVHIFASSFQELVCFGFPAIVLGGFFRRRLILHLQSSETLALLKERKTLILPCLRYVDRIIVPSEHGRGILKSIGLRSEKAVDMVDPDLFPSRRVSTLQPRILVACPLEPQNNVGTVIRACLMVKQKYPRTELVILGKGQQRRELELLASRDNGYGIEFVDRVRRDQTGEYLHEADLYVNASSSGDIPISLLEALASGIPVISSRVGGVSEVITDGHSGLLFEAGNEVDLANRIIQLIEDDRLTAELSVRARAEAEKHAWDNMKNAWKTRYLQVARR
jgi:glycosyltransferase involved in cell wall biosynthesis